jgi:endo-1,4-beta-xylanase
MELKLPSLGRAVMGAVGAGVLLVGLATPSSAADPVLRDLAEAHGRYFGTAVTASMLSGTYADIAGSQFDSITPSNEMKW